MPSGDLADSCRALVVQLRDEPHSAALPHAGDALPHARAAPATLDDHLLSTAALVCCLADGHPRRDLLRLAALSHDLPEAKWDARLTPDSDARRWIDLLRRHGDALDQRTAPALPDDPDERLLAQAHLAAAARLPMRRKDDFAGHLLAAAPAVDLVYGGATRIKQYVFESARLPEIRGASALLDHINRLDLPALWGVTPKLARQHQRYQETRDWLAAAGAAPLDAPECVLYASGGNILALAPAGRGAQLAEAIERRYTEVTQVAASVAVWETVSLLELQYGRCPRDFWLDDLERMLALPALRRLLVDSYGIGAGILRDESAFQRWVGGQDTLTAEDLAAFRAWVFGADSLPEEDAALLGEHERPQAASRKGFGELVTLLAAKADRRRAGDGAETGAPRSTPFVDLISAARRCSSCDARPAAREMRQPNQQYLCAACGRKRDAGYWAKQGRPPGDAPETDYPWLVSWGEWLEYREPVPVRATANDLPEIGQAASGRASGFVGLVYADGNNVGNHIAGLSSIAGYRHFAQQMLDANEQAVARALRAHLAADTEGVWPFEIITIGGDDVLLFVPADRALAIAAAIAEDFGRQMESEQITLSAGVLIMADSTPVRFARDLVEELLKSAKQLSKDGAGAATIDFMVLKAATMVSETIKEYRRAAFVRLNRSRRGDTTRLMLTQRPYPLDHFHALLDAGRELAAARFPPSQLHQLAEIVGAGQQLRAMVDYRYFVGRGRARERDGGSYARFEHAIGPLCGQQDTAPWRADEAAGGSHSQAYDTPLLDLVEILPFIGTAPQEQRP